jgi:hypothetical protein
MEGDAIVVNGTTIIQDGGKVEYSFTDAPGSWNIVPGSEIYYDNDWTDEEFTIDTTGEDTLFIRFVFFSDPAFCYEGWYIDDVCLEGLIPGTEDTGGYTEFVMDSHSWEQTFNTSCIEHTFEESWIAEEGEYLVCTWFQVLDDCHFPEYTSDNQYCIEITVADTICLEDTDLWTSISNPAWEGDDVIIYDEVTNLGTIAAEDVQVQVTVERGAISEKFDDDVESGPYNADTYDHYSSSAYPGTDVWHITTFDSYSGSHAWFYSDSVTHNYPNGCGEFDAPYYDPGNNFIFGIMGDTFGMGDSGLGPVWSFMGKWVLDETGPMPDYMTYGLYDNSTGTAVRWTTYSPTSSIILAVGVQDTWTNVEVDFSSFLADVGESGDFDYDGNDWRPMLSTYTSLAGNTVGGYSWSGILCDDFNIKKIETEPGIIFQETQVIDIINASESKVIGFEWDNVLAGQYVITKEILGDIGDCNGKLIMPYNVINYFLDTDDGTIEFVDHTCGDDGHAMVDDCCGGSIWFGDPETTMYGNDWDDSLFIAPDGNVTQTYEGKDLYFKTWYQMNETTADAGYIEASNTSGLHWDILETFTGYSHTDPAGESEWIDIGPIDLSGHDYTQVRFRFISDSNFTDRGWMIDDVYIDGIIDDPCETMDNFIPAETCRGNWWFTPDQYYYWWGLSMIDYIFFGYAAGYTSPEYTFGVYDPWGYPSEWYFPVEIYPPNIDCSLDWTIDTTDVFYGYFRGYAMLDFPAGDTILFQYNTDGTSFNDFVQPSFWAGNLNLALPNGGVGDETIFRARATTDNLMYAYWDGVAINDLVFYGMKDTHAPTTTITMQGTFDETYHYYTSDVGITLEASDDITGVAHTYYILDGVESEYTRPFVIEEDGEHTLCVYSVDNEGNVEEQKCVSPFMIDQTGPSISITGPEPGIYLFGNKILNSDKYIFLFGGVTITASVSVDDAPLQTVEFYMNNELFAEDTASPFSMKCTLKNSGAATFKVVAKDVLGESDQDELTVDTDLKIF